jgi:hypothetical protein
VSVLLVQVLHVGEKTLQMCRALRRHSTLSEESFTVLDDVSIETSQFLVQPHLVRWWQHFR